MNKIEPIDQESIHRICSGQVILDLATAVKELVENSLDAGATRVDVRLKGYGLESIEVHDNGKGIEKDNYEALTKKHWTSKIKDFSDLGTVTSFGFRGEALSSLCAISTLSVTTQCVGDLCGTQLDYDRNGQLISTKPIARAVGTTVKLTNIFDALPVRLKNFEKNIQKEFTRILDSVTAYALICVGVRISCSNQVASKPRSVCVNTEGSPDLKGNILSVYGSKQAQHLEAWEVDLAAVPLSDESKMQDRSCLEGYRVKGYISKIDHECGRCSRDRQHLFINSRPVDLPKINKLINEIYRSHCNYAKYPVFALDWLLPLGSFDVNVSPNKRTVFLQKENEALGALRDFMTTKYAPSRYTFTVQPLNFTPKLSRSKSEENANVTNVPTSTTLSLSTPLTNCPTTTITTPTTTVTTCPAFSPSSPEKTLPSLPRTLSSPTSFSTPSSPLPPSLTSFKSKPTLSLENFAFSTQKRPRDEGEDKETSSPIKRTPSGAVCFNSFKCAKSSENFNDNNEEEENSSTLSSLPRTLSDTFSTASTLVCDDSEMSQEELSQDMSSPLPSSSSFSSSILSPPLSARSSSDRTLDARTQALQVLLARKRSDESSAKPQLPQSASSSSSFMECKRSSYGENEQAEEEDSRDTRVLQTSLPGGRVNPSVVLNTRDFKRRLQEALQPSENEAKRKQADFGDRASGQASPGDLGGQLGGVIPETVMKRVVQKEDFTQMQILGQFNLGFIITKIGSHLFIIDQHATDEKYRFEMLQQSTSIKQQPLFVPMKLDTTAANEVTIMAHLDIFRANGFEIVCEETEQSSRLRLKTLPFSKSTHFGMDDIVELCGLLNETPGVMTRLPKITKMFASRACRSAVMIGTALSVSKMSQIVKNMALMNHPWNCPHGRPTMRHLFDMSLLGDFSLPPPTFSFLLHDDHFGVGEVTPKATDGSDKRSTDGAVGTRFDDAIHKMSPIADGSDLLEERESLIIDSDDEQENGEVATSFSCSSSLSSSLLSSSATLSSACCSAVLESTSLSSPSLPPAVPDCVPVPPLRPPALADASRSLALPPLVGAHESSRLIDLTNPSQDSQLGASLDLPVSSSPSHSSRAEKKLQKTPSKLPTTKVKPKNVLLTEMWAKTPSPSSRITSEPAKRVSTDSWLPSRQDSFGLSSSPSLGGRSLGIDVPTDTVPLRVRSGASFLRAKVPKTSSGSWAPD